MWKIRGSPTQRAHNETLLHLQICSICLRLAAVSSFTEIQYLQIEPNGKRTHAMESKMLKMFYLYGFVWWTKCICWAIENNYLLFYKLIEFAVEWIPATEIKQKLSSVQNITCITAIVHKKIRSVFFVP